MLLPLPVEIGKVGHRQHRWATARWSTEQRSLKPVIIPLRPKWPRDLGGLGSLQVLMSGSRPIAQLRAIARSPRPTSNFNRRTSLILRTDNLLAGKLILPFEGRLLAIVLSSAYYVPVEIIPAKPNAVTGSA
jgi:hypothetical protein